MNAVSRIERIPIKNAPKVGTATYTFSVEVDEKKCNGCAKCAIECPSRIIEMVGRESTGIQKSACADACSAGNGARDAIKAIADGGTYEDAWHIITKTNPIPAVTGRVCPHPCETDCNRANLDKAVNVHQFERFIGDYGLVHNLAFKKPANQDKGKVAVVGAGPAGIGCAYKLALMGYKVTVFEAMSKAGGMLNYGIPEYRLPRDIVNKEVKRIEDLGVEFKYNVTLGKDIQLENLKKDYKAVFVALGAQEEVKLGLNGEDSSNFFTGLGFLKAAADKKPIELGNDVVVVGGGNVAIDAARSALRTGARNVTLICLEKKYEMPAWKSEIEEAIEEGVKIVNGYGPMKLVTENGKVKKIMFKQCTSVFDNEGRFSPKYDENVNVDYDVDSVIASIGQKPEDLSFLKNAGLKLGNRGHIAIIDPEKLSTSYEGIFAGGDVTRADGAGKIIGGVGMGYTAALAMDSYIQGTPSKTDEVNIVYNAVFPENRYSKELERNDGGSISMKERFVNAANEVNLPFDEKTVMDELNRCLLCGTGKANYTGPQTSEKFNVACNNCHNCVNVCPENAITFHYYTKKKEDKWV